MRRLSLAALLGLAALACGKSTGGLGQPCSQCGNCDPGLSCSLCVAPAGVCIKPSSAVLGACCSAHDNCQSGTCAGILFGPYDCPASNGPLSCPSSNSVYVCGDFCPRAYSPCGACGLCDPAAWSFGAGHCCASSDAGTTSSGQDAGLDGGVDSGVVQSEGCLACNP